MVPQPLSYKNNVLYSFLRDVYKEYDENECWGNSFFYLSVRIGDDTYHPSVVAQHIRSGLSLSYYEDMPNAVICAQGNMLFCEKTPRCNNPYHLVEPDQKSCELLRSIVSDNHSHSAIGKAVVEELVKRVGKSMVENFEGHASDADKDLLEQRMKSLSLLSRFY